MKYIYRLTLFSALMMVFGAKAQTVTIGAGALSGASSNVGVIYRSAATSAFDFSQQYFLYTAAELSAAGVPPGAIITSVAWFKDNAFGTTAGNTSDIWEIYMKNSSTAAAAGWSNASFATQSAGASLVYSNTSQVIPLTTGWVTLNLGTSFVYTGGSLEIGSNWNCSLFSGSPSTGAYSWKRDNISNVCFGSSNSVATFNMTSQTARPQIQITYVPGVACSGAPVAGTTVSSSAAVCPSTPFNVSLTGNTLASGLTYQWQSSVDGITYTNILGATNSSYSASQIADTYYQCIVTCTSAALSSTSAPVLVTTNSFLNCYCTSAATNVADEDILGVSIGNLNNVTSCGTGGGPGSVSSLYSDFTNTTPPTTVPVLIQGLSYPMSVNVGTCGTGSFNNMTKVYIDYNQNGLFTDAGEEVYVSPTFTSGAHLETFLVSIPMASPSGITRMRVVTVETTVAANINPCGTYTYGETEDYFVNIAVPLTDDAGIDAFVTPSIPTCNFSDSIRVALTNYGSDTLFSATIYLSLNGGVPTTTSWTGALPSFATDTVNLGVFSLTSGMNLLAYTQLPNAVVENPSGSWNDTASISNLSAGLTGTYTIGGLNPDYLDFAAAVAALTTFDICSAVVFEVRDGSYPEQLTLPSLINSSATNTVTFRSENGDPSLVDVTFASSSAADNYVVRFSNTDHFIFENLTLKNNGASFGRVIDFAGGSDNNRIEGCELLTNIGTSTSNNMSVISSTGGLDNNNVFKNNLIEGGSYGAYWYGANTTSAETGNVFEGNRFMSNYYYGASLYYNNGIVVKNNTISGPSAYTFRYGLYMYYCNGAPIVTGNNIVGSGTTGFVYGLYMSQCGGNSANLALVANNMVQVGFSGSTSTMYGLYFTGSGYINAHHNSVLASAGGSSSRALFATGGGEIYLLNNIFANYVSGGFASYIGNAFTIVNSDYNVLYSPTGNIGYFNGNAATLANWQSASAFDANSIDYNPNFFSNFDLHVCNDSVGNQGTPLAMVAIDIDGHTRSSLSPDMGADEFSGLSGSFLGNDLTVCSGDSVQLIAGSPTDTILWSTGATTSSIWVSTPGSYTVSVNSACGSGVDAIVVTASALNYANYMAYSNLSFCAGDSVLLYSTQSADTYTWTGGSTDDSLYVTAGGTYALTITDNCGSGTEALTVTMNTLPTAQFTSQTSFMTGIFTNTSVSSGNTTYLWDFGDGTSSTIMNPSHIYTSTGVYTVVLTVTNDCGTNVYTSTITISIVGIEELGGIASFEVFPNPSAGAFSIQFDLQHDMALDVEVTDLLGKVIARKQLNGKAGLVADQVDLSKEADGVYYLTLKTNSLTLATKMLIKE